MSRLEFAGQDGLARWRGQIAGIAAGDNVDRLQEIAVVEVEGGGVGAAVDTELDRHVRGRTDRVQNDEIAAGRQSAPDDGGIAGHGCPGGRPVGVVRPFSGYRTDPITNRHCSPFCIGGCAVADFNARRVVQNGATPGEIGVPWRPRVRSLRTVRRSDQRPFLSAILPPMSCTISFRTKNQVPWCRRSVSR